MSQRELYERVWRDPEYRRKHHGLRLYNEHPDIFPEFESAIELGCGLGYLFARWASEGKDAYGLDIADNCLDPGVREEHGDRFVRSSLLDMDLGRCFDLGVCTDVMEHIIEPELPLVVKNITEHCGEVLYKVANFRSVWFGENLHPTRRDAEWWAEMLASNGGTVERLDIPSHREEYVFRWKR